MSKKKKKGKKAGRNSRVAIANKDYGFTVLVFDYIKNQFYCPHCKSEVNWTGGRYGGAQVMEVLSCSKCGRTTDPRLVWSEAIRLLADWERRQEEYKVGCAHKAALAEEARREAARVAAYNRTLRGRLNKVLSWVS